MWDFDTECSEVLRRTPTIKSFRFSIRAKNVRFRAGQFFYMDILVAGEKARHHFSFSNSPAERGYLEFTKRITASAYSQALDALKPGDWAHLSGPEGEFTLSRKWKKLAFLSGGIGITPLRSMMRYSLDKGLDYDIVLLYGNSSYEEIAFREELEAMERATPRLRVVHVLIAPPPGWRGKVGRIDSALMAEVIPDYRERLFYISGPPRMVMSLEDQLLALGLPQEQVKRDSFIGYE
ncbi:MAG: FAD-dependent oxidoreductase [Chloroflexi bacterium]|nr:FAD-dependent oxidoreductase [Chloroflexota bacterium]